MPGREGLLNSDDKDLLYDDESLLDHNNALDSELHNIYLAQRIAKSLCKSLRDKDYQISIDSETNIHELLTKKKFWLTYQNNNYFRCNDPGKEKFIELITQYLEKYFISHLNIFQKFSKIVGLFRIEFSKDQMNDFEAICSEINDEICDLQLTGIVKCQTISVSD